MSKDADFLGSRSPIEVPRETLVEWQSILDTLATVMDVPAGLIMRLNEPRIEVFLRSETEGNPYSPGDSEQVWGSGLYCERVIQSGQALCVPNALADPEWANNPDVKLGMVSYLGYPIRHGDGRPFGTLCVLDRGENYYSAAYQSLMEKLRNLIETHLALLEVNAELGDQNRRVTDYLEELQYFRGLVSICSHCKRIEDLHGVWQPVEHWLVKHPTARFSHGICPTCFKVESDRLGW